MLTETYSPVPMLSAPAVRAAIPAITIAPLSVGRAGDAHHDAGGRHDAVVGAQHRGAQPVEPGADVVAQVVVEVLGLLVGADLHAHA